MKTYNPATGELLREYTEHTPAEVQERIADASCAFTDWKRVPLAERVALLARMASQLDKQRDELASLVTSEMGKPIAQAEAEVEKCAWGCRHYAEHAQEYLRPENIPTDFRSSYVRYDPLGPILAIMPWNFPLWQVFRHLAPALAAGNVVLLKHATSVTGTALAIERLVRDANAPPGLLSVLLIPSDQVAEVIGNSAVRAVTLTGSEKAGAAVATVAGKQLKKCVLELGGSDAFIVLADADLDQAAETAAKARTQNTGQSCIAAKRFLVEDAIADRFVAAFTARMKALTVGDPMDRNTDVGPLCREDLRDDLHDQVTRTLTAGATLHTGGQPLDRAGWFYQPTVLTGVHPGMAAFDEETFGPVAAVTPVRNAEHAVELANASCYGLGGAVFTRDVSRGEEIAGRLDTGTVAVNGMVASDPRLPFGGVKHSGYGRELGRWGIREFTNIKTVMVQK